MGHRVSCRTGPRSSASATAVGSCGYPPAGGTPKPVGRVAQTRAAGEGGLLGLAVPPGPDPSFVFAYVTTATDNRVLRIAWDGTRLGRSRAILTGIPKGTNHNGGRLLVGPDDTLFVATGEVYDPPLAQKRSSLGGKILRVTFDGSPAPGNPFRGSPVYSLGHRNVQGLAFDSAGRLWASEFGDRDADELNLIRPGGNYGWPVHEGKAGDPRYIDPRRAVVADVDRLAERPGDRGRRGLRGEPARRTTVAGSPARHDRGGSRRPSSTAGSVGCARSPRHPTDGCGWRPATPTGVAPPAPAMTAWSG